MDSFIIYNHAMLTTSAFTPVALGTSLKTHLQLATASNRRIWIDGWGFTLDAAPTAISKIELLQTDVAANTGTAHVASGIQKLDSASSDNSSLQLGTALTGFNFGAEGSTTASRLLGHDILPANPATDRLRFEQWFFPDDRRPIIAASSFLRIRTTMGSAVNGLLWIAISD